MAFAFQSLRFWELLRRFACKRRRKIPFSHRPPSTITRLSLHTDKLDELEKKTGVSKVYFALIFITIFCGLLYLAGGAKLIVDLAGFLYPAYMSFKALETAQTDDDVQWLTYWVVFASFSIIEQTIGFVVTFVPFYYYLKIAFLVWLYAPQFTGATTLYNQAIRPLVMPLLGTEPQKKTE